MYIKIFKRMDNTTIESSQGMANIFNEYFVKIDPNTASCIPTSNISHRHYLSGSNCSSIFLSPTNSEEIRSIINSFSRKKAAGPDKI